MPSAGRALLHRDDGFDEFAGIAYEKTVVDPRVWPEHRLKRGLIEPIEGTAVARIEFGDGLLGYEGAECGFHSGFHPRKARV